SFEPCAALNKVIFVVHYRNGGGGAQIGKRRLLIPQKIHLYPGESIRSSSFRAVVSDAMDVSVKIGCERESRNLPGQ
ncbi:hypothetical protein, partial [uncultured Dialister sp.]|uniref:hypothetical protein n=1 Tax=uncultured Dialister sp. TaxID=278064 RepID=UPI00265EA9AB